MRRYTARACTSWPYLAASEMAAVCGCGWGSSGAGATCWTQAEACGVIAEAAVTPLPGASCHAFTRSIVHSQANGAPAAQPPRGTDLHVCVLEVRHGHVEAVQHAQHGSPAGRALLACRARGARPRSRGVWVSMPLRSVRGGNHTGEHAPAPPGRQHATEVQLRGAPHCLIPPT